ncbi:phosphotransferase family protein [Cytobacillus spongiae]|jgi:aminoglycoside phosphotransferase (APT) family kinase protein|uniref:phosphotransferase family protein n=1 Tax=Cytobacillus spongiae TaxID=2901381 RepID=UPI001F4770E0|nr:phosphotransferase family protein [Cytobacillus spongiae]UII56801.1 phosphotransferase family protein [Cytobacillus spongiae]
MPNQKFSDTIHVRKGEELHVNALEGFLKENIVDFPNEPLEVLQFSAGHSNLTYELKAGDWNAVLRRPPLGPVAPKAHDMEREYQILSEVYPYYSVAPKPILYSDNLSIVSSPFLLMERKKGIVLDTDFPEGIKVTQKLCRQLSEKMVDQLVSLHQVDYRQTGLVDISKPQGFMERQVHGWIKRYDRAETDHIPQVDRLKKWLIDHIPVYADATIIHYDYKLNNAMFTEDLDEMVGLFDWEMSTVGDPLADLGAAMSYWTQSDDPPLLKNGLGKPPVTVLDGFMSRTEFIEAYARKSGRDVSNINFYVTFAYFKLAVICQQIYYRYQKGQTNDSRFSQFNHFVRSLITQGEQMTSARNVLD